MKISITYLLIFLSFNVTFAQSQDFKKAPNSYIFDKGVAQDNNYDGIYIPIKKAYEMWANYEYLKTGGVATPIPSGIQTASIYWEDVPGIIRDASIETGATPQDSKIKIRINNSFGNGNAVVAFKVDGTIYWSWHIWITDDPSNGVSYGQGFETNIDNVAFQVQYMDRNLGALSNNFLGNNWQKSSGLLYEWGRKDPFPPLVYKDLYFYEINSELGSLKHSAISSQTIPVITRPFDEIEKNIQYSVLNPLNYIINTDSNNWFSNSLYKTAGTGTSYTTWDLWSDNYRGGNSNANSSGTTLKTDSRSYELKSELDPCPNGWRIPSYYGRVTTNNNLSPWGRTGNWQNDDSSVTTSGLFPDSQNSVLNGIKVYPGLGMDFTNAQAGNRNLGIMPMTGAFVYYPNSPAPNAIVGTMYQDENSIGTLWSATFAYDGARLLGLKSDPAGTGSKVGTHGVYINTTNPTKTGNAVRCMKDPNILKIGDFATEYFTSTKTDFTSGLNNPNSYLVTNETVVNIPVNKPFAVYNQLLSDREMLASDHLVAKVNWTTNTKAVKSIKIVSPTSNPLESYIEVTLNPSEKGNFVVSLHNQDTTNPAYWSWHIWIPNGDPTAQQISYVTEQPIATQYNFVNPTKSLVPPLVTTFMDRNLGSVEAFAKSTDANFIQSTKGLLYQWGRKDALPSFAGVVDAVSNSLENVIYLGSENQTDNNVLQFTKINNSNYLTNYTSEFQSYNSQNTDKYKRIIDNIKYSVQNPLTFLYKTGIGQLYDGGNKNNNNQTEIRDWVSDDRSQANERWGHADKKSVYDPCPQGWRVPDVSLTSLYSGSKGNSPFYNSYVNDWTGKPGVIQDQWSNVAQSYMGTADTNGWIFTSSTYPIGNYSSDGIRGELGGNNLTSARSGVWTASLADLHTGYALAMQFQGSQMQTGTGVYPQAAMSVRCVKDEVRYLGVAVAITNTGIGTLATNSPKIDKNDLSVYPNPFADELNFNDKSVKSYEIFDFSGRILSQGEIKDAKINTKNLQKGVYFIKVLMQNGSYAYKKIIKH